MVYVIIVFLVVVVLALVVPFKVRAKRERTNRYRKMSEETKYVLPDGRNEYLRSRLQTVLAVAEADVSEADARFLHAKKLLYSLAEKKLSAADSLLMHKLQKDVNAYAVREYFARGDKANIAGILSKILTLCAKYDV